MPLDMVGAFETSIAESASIFLCKVVRVFGHLIFENRELRLDAPARGTASTYKVRSTLD